MIELLLEAERALSMGRADRAEVLYKQVAASDPRNSIAVVGLARVALERSDDAGALVLARRALAIDGENVAAQRLVQRLEEVLRTRGEALPAPEAIPVAEAPPPPVGETAPPRSTPKDTAAEWPSITTAKGPGAPWPGSIAPAAEPVDDHSAHERSTPFDGPDPVLADPPDSRPPTGGGSATSPSRRSLLDRLRGR